MNKQNFKADYFNLAELTNSDTARRLGIDNTPSQASIANLQLLCKYILDPIRRIWGQPVIVSSGYRCPKLNAAVHGARYSQHTLGQAADIRTVTDSPEDNMRLLRTIINADLPFDKLIAEYVDDKGRPDWIHISYSSKIRRIMLTCKNGKYTQGIRI